MRNYDMHSDVLDTRSFYNVSFFKSFKFKATRPETKFSGTRGTLDATQNTF